MNARSQAANKNSSGKRRKEHLQYLHYLHQQSIPPASESETPLTLSAEEVKRQALTRFSGSSEQGPFIMSKEDALEGKSTHVNNNFIR